MRFLAQTLTTVLSSLALTIAVLAGARADNPTLQAKTQEARPAKKVERVNINTADLATLKKLPGVGPVIAKRIIAFREAHGGFKRAEEILNVKGIGEKTFERLQPLIRI